MASDRSWPTSCALFAGALAVYVACARDGFYRGDGERFVAMIVRDCYGHYAHPLYPRALQLVAGVTEPLGLSAFRVATLTSALGTALAVLLLHRAALHVASRSQALLVASLCGLSPAVFLFATVVEVHGVFLAAAAAAWLAACRHDRYPSLWRALLAGAATALAAHVHGTGQLLPLALVLWLLGGRGRDGRLRAASLSGWAHGTALLAAHAAGCLLIGTALAAVSGWRGSWVATQLDYLRDDLASGRALDALGAAAQSEWLLPFLPLSIAFLAAARRGAEPWRALGLAIAVASYVAVSAVLLGGVSERGAYLLPLAFPAALLAVRHLPRAAALAALACSPVLIWWGGVYGERPVPDDPVPPSRYAADVAEATASERPLLVLGAQHEAGLLLRAGADTPFVFGVEWLPRDVAPSAFSKLCQSFEQFAARVRAAGQTLYLTESVYEQLAAARDHPVGRLLFEHILTRHTTAWVVHGSFRALRVD